MLLGSRPPDSSRALSPNTQPAGSAFSPLFARAIQSLAQARNTHLLPPPVLPTVCGHNARIAELHGGQRREGVARGAAATTPTMTTTRAGEKVVEHAEKGKGQGRGAWASVAGKRARGRGGGRRKKRRSAMFGSRCAICCVSFGLLVGVRLGCACIVQGLALLCFYGMPSDARERDVRALLREACTLQRCVVVAWLRYSGLCRQGPMCLSQLFWPLSITIRTDGS